jgi:hypothetical protein
MDIRQLQTFTPTGKAAEVQFRPPLQGPVGKVEVPKEEPKEVFSPTGITLPEELPVLTNNPVNVPSAQIHPSLCAPPLSWQDGDVTYSGTSNGTIVTLQEQPPSSQGASIGRGLTLAEVLANITVQPEPSAAKAMSEREGGYLKVFPYKEDEAALKTRHDLNVRYNDPTTSAESMTHTLNNHAIERGVEIDKVPPNLIGDLSKDNLAEVKKATQGIVDKLFLSQQASFNPEKHATVTQETERFLDLAMQVAPKGFSAADAYKLVAGNLALISYQDKAAAENMLGDHGVRHLLGHNIKACEQLADGLEKRGIPVNSMDRLVMHQAMIVHDLGYAMDSVRNPINSEGLKGQDAGHNVLAARYLRERSQNPDDPLAKLFGQGDLERMHRCVLYHDKDVQGGPGVHFNMNSTLTDDERAGNLETMTRVADNSHAFEDKLPELLYRKPQSLKAMRMMKTAGEIGDKALVETFKAELAELIKTDATLAKDDREALLQSVSSVNAKSYQYSVGRISGGKPTFDVDEAGKVYLSVVESGVHQQTSALFGMESHKQMEKFVKDCSGEKVSLKGCSEIIEGKDVCVIVSGPTVALDDEFNSELHKGLLQDKAFVKFALVDSQLSSHQSILEQRQKLGTPGLDEAIGKVKERRRAVLDDYRTGA